MSIVLDQAALNTDLAASSALSTLHWAQQEFEKDYVSAVVDAGCGSDRSRYAGVARY